MTTPPGIATMRMSATINGMTQELEIEPRDLLVDVLRNRLGLTGTKRSCDVQVCGACTVLLDDRPVSACSTLAIEADGRTVLTIEGVSRNGEMDRIQRAFVDHGALQCGFCTPGFVLAVRALLSMNEKPSDETIAHFLRGNICRCTGYVKILEAVKSLV
jgi:carbon-monoxide dehydrogenase small subunit